MKLNLGAADRHMSGYISVDIAPPADQIVDLAGPWPWEDSSVEEVLAFDVCEHIGDRIHFMNQLHRVLKPGGLTTIETPDASRGAGFWQDPTHVSPWCRSTFRYFEHGAFAHTRLAKSYGITASFRVVGMWELGPMPGEGYGEQVWKIRAVLEAVK